NPRAAGRSPGLVPPNRGVVTLTPYPIRSRTEDRTMIRLMAGCTLCLVLAGASRADFDTEKYANWHHWRGPDANGIAPKADPPLTWDVNTNIKWKTELPGPGSSTPVVWGDRVFVLAAVKTNRVAKAEELPKLDPQFK